jgi:hypothetical protein
MERQHGAVGAVAHDEGEAVGSVGGFGQAYEAVAVGAPLREHPPACVVQLDGCIRAR